MNLNVPVELHNSFKAATAARGQNMTDELLKFIESYVIQILTQTKRTAEMKRAALYTRVSTLDQHPETQLLDLRQMAAQRGYQIVQEYTDRISGAKAKRPGLDQMMADARRGQLRCCPGLGIRPNRPLGEALLEVLDELNRSQHRVRQLPGKYRHRRSTGPGHRGDHRRDRGTGTQPDHRAGACRHAARPARRHAHRSPTLTLDHEAIQRERCQGQSLRQIAKGHRISTATVQRVLHRHALASQEKVA